MFLDSSISWLSHAVAEEQVRGKTGLKKVNQLFCDKYAITNIVQYVQFLIATSQQATAGLKAKTLTMMDFLVGEVSVRMC